MAVHRPDRPHAGTEAEEPGPRGTSRDTEDGAGDRAEDRERHDADTATGDGPRHPSRAAELVERDTGAHAEQISDEGTLRADTSPPGSDEDRDG